MQNPPLPPAPRQAAVILGMHRSGTSALAGALARLGFAPPRRPLTPHPQSQRLLRGRGPLSISTPMSSPRPAATGTPASSSSPRKCARPLACWPIAPGCCARDSAPAAISRSRTRVCACFCRSCAGRAEIRTVRARRSAIRRSSHSVTRRTSFPRSTARRCGCTICWRASFSPAPIPAASSAMTPCCRIGGRASARPRGRPGWPGRALGRHRRPGGWLPRRQRPPP